MAGPIISGGSPRGEVLLLLVLLVLACMAMSPETTQMFLQKMPWVSSFVSWSRHFLGLPPW